MDNLERDMMNRQYMYEAHSFLGNPAIPALPPHCGVPTTATLPAVIPSQIPSSHHPSGSTGSTSGSEHYLYDENSSDNESVYSSDQENHAREWVLQKCLPSSDFPLFSKYRVTVPCRKCVCFTSDAFHSVTQIDKSIVMFLLLVQRKIEWHLCRLFVIKWKAPFWVLRFLFLFRSYKKFKAVLSSLNLEIVKSLKDFILIITENWIK